MVSFPGSTTPSEDDLGLRLARAQLDLLLGLREVRIAKRMSVQDVANEMGVDPAQVSRLESGGTNPTMASVRRYAAAVGALFSAHVRDFAEVRGTERASAELQARFRDAVHTSVTDFSFLSKPVPIGIETDVPRGTGDGLTDAIAGGLIGGVMGAFTPHFGAVTNVVVKTFDGPLRIKEPLGPHRPRFEKKAAVK